MVHDTLRDCVSLAPTKVKEVPLSTQRFQIGILGVVALVALRMGLGCHFLYEGVWKITHSSKFSAEPFLTDAKGPLSALFYAMVPDIDARQRLKVETAADGKKSVDSTAVIERWDGIRQEFVAYYRPAASADEAMATAHKRLEASAEQTAKEFRDKLQAYLKANVGEIAAYFGALDRFESDKEQAQQAPFQKQRRWDRMLELRREADKWITEIEAQEKAYKNSLYSLLDEQQKQQGQVPASWNPFNWRLIDVMTLAVTYSLTAIGLCLMLGFCTPLAAMGGACFMCFVVGTQPAFPGIYPPDPMVVGHALLVNKDFVELLALLTVAATAAGRWGGLDYILYHSIIHPLLSWRKKRAEKSR